MNFGEDIIRRYDIELEAARLRWVAEIRRAFSELGDRSEA